jgi:hypothetical protein
LQNDSRSGLAALGDAVTMNDALNGDLRLFTE